MTDAVYQQRFSEANAKAERTQFASVSEKADDPSQAES